ncbi:transcription factor bHLH96-like [Phalaenopsis equestris]|uniref:transcription factor bHLH96-like n=1 Tax=Phalaenopsis equestris TaxID=78828 RepID=UPI0009E3BE50|nr:transcription factor bHLH96-like [Phalaenopsis equestris]
MALEAVVFPQNLLSCNVKEFYGLTEEEEEQAFYGNWEVAYSSLAQGFEEWNTYSSNLTPPRHEFECTANVAAAAGVEEERSGRKKRRRNKTSKNEEEVKNQRMTHIAVERNRRKQMNYYLALLRSLMPPSYVQRGDQASIISGAINFVRELEQFLQFLEVQKHLKQQIKTEEQDVSSPINPLTNFFTSPQYTSPPSAAAIEVGIVESHANLKLLSRRQPKQLPGLQNLQLTILHLNVTSVEPMVLYCFSLKVEDDCRLNSVDEIAAAVHEIVLKNQEEEEILLR